LFHHGVSFLKGFAESPLIFSEGIFMLWDESALKAENSKRKRLQDKGELT
jgi:hypothetical protein